jgi:hypothetical protein
MDLVQNGAPVGDESAMSPAEVSVRNL